MKAIEAFVLEKRYGRKVALDRVSFSVEPGDAVGLLGPNGSGKTTLLRILATLLKPSGGHASVMGLDGRFEATRIRKTIGYMPDQPGLDDDLSVEETLDYFAALHGLGGTDATVRVRGLLDLLDLGGVAARPAGRLSRGQQQRVALARTLIHDPSVLLLDEPAANLDPRARVELLAVLRELRKMGKTLVVSSHILPELEGFCTRIVVMREGRVVFEGSPETGALRVGAGRRVFIRATGGSGDLKALLASDAAAEAVAEVEEGLLVALKDPSGDPGFVARRAVEAGWSIQELRIDRPGLQELFLNLTSPPGDGP